MSSSKSNERLSYKIGIGLPKLARSLLTLIGSGRINYIFKIKVGRFRKRYLSCNSLLKKKSCYHQYFLKQCSKHASRIERYTSVTIDEVEKPVLTVMCSNWLMWLWLTKSFNKESWIAATAVLFNTHIKTNILASWWIKMMLGCITTIKWWKKIDLKCSWLQAR